MIIGFAGKAAAGKTTAAQYLASRLTGEVLVLPMAKVLRDEVEAFLRQAGATDAVPLVYGCQDDKVRVFYLDEQQALAGCPRWPDFVAAHRDIQDRPGQTAMTVRRILQWWGTEYRRSDNPDYWTDAWSRAVRLLDLSAVHVLIDDVRFVNELNAVKGQGGSIVKIERPGFNGANNHASETALDDYQHWDRVIRNDGSLEDFYRSVEAVLP
ncbi:MAG: hypothetical protein C0618_08300 [Desulfuromonas sp.]|nr:MAG: hypothetical protein C0618_08300 [Desulfuromonas sp.]